MTKELLSKIKLKNRIIPLAQIKELTPAIIQIKSRPVETAIKNKLESVLADLKNYSEMSLNEQVVLSKKITRVLNATTLFSAKDIGLIIERDYEDFVKSLDHKKNKLGVQSAQTTKEIEQLKNLLSLWRAKASQISEVYAKLPEEQKISLSQFLTEYLKEKRTRAIDKEYQSQDLKERETQLLKDLRSAIISIDEAIQLATREGNQDLKAELLRIREWSENITVPDKVGEGVIAKKFKFGDLKGIVDRKGIVIENRDFVMSFKRDIKGNDFCSQRG